MAKRSYFGDILRVLSSNVFTLFANLLVAILLARLLGPQQYGLYTAILVVPVLVVSFFQMGIRGTTIHILGSRTEKDDKVISAVFFILLFTSFLGIVFSALAYLFTDTTGYTPLLIALALGVIPLRLTNIYIGGIFLGKEEIPKANLVNWLTGLLMLLLTLLLVLVLRGGLRGALTAMLWANFIVAVVAISMVLRQFKFRFKAEKTLVKRILKTGVVFALSFLVIQLNYRVDVLLLKKMAGATETGIYSLGVSIAELLWQIPLAIGVVVMSRSANASDLKKMTLQTTQLLRVSLISGCLLSIAIIVLSPWLVPLVFGEQFIPSVAVMQWIMPGILMVIAFRIVSGQLSGMGRPDVAIKAFTPALLVNVGLNYLLIPKYGAWGAVMATNLSYAMATFIYVVMFARVTGIQVRAIFTFSRADWNFLSRFRRK
ncbi:Polysaccharide biosynthesis protein [anaerobic digester metagenome]|nr:flippase [Lentimicrobiaceae bacterium]